MSAPLSSSTRLFAVLGDPVRHSLSPAFQNAALQASGVDAVYLALQVSSERLPCLMHGLAQAGGGGNVTVPHKELAMSVAEHATEAVRRTGACNTFWYERGKLWGDNTDPAGFARAIQRLLGRSPAGARVLLIGAGGAARAAAYALVDEGASEIVVLNRSPERGRLLVERFDSPTTRLRPVTAPDSLSGESFDLAVNATSLGLKAGDPLPLGANANIHFAAAFDLVYAPERTLWVKTLRSQGIPAEDGLEMLLLQGAAAFERWWQIDAPLEAMRAALPDR